MNNNEIHSAVAKANKLALACYKSKKFDEAELLSKKIIKIDRDNFDAYNLLGVIYLEKDNNGFAVECFKKALEINDLDYNANYHLGVALTRVSSLEKAEEYLIKSLVIKPDFALGHQALAGVYRRRKKYEDAINEYKQCLKNDETQLASYNNLGYTYRLIGDHKKAISCFEEVIKRDSSKLDVYSNLLFTLLSDTTISSDAYFKKAIEFGKIASEIGRAHV